MDDQEKSCGDCWWQEGGRCYRGDPPRDNVGRSKVPAVNLCEHFDARRLRHRVAEAIGKEYP